MPGPYEAYFQPVLKHQFLKHLQASLRQSSVFVPLATDPVAQRGDDAEIDVHGLEIHHAPVGDIVGQSAQSGLSGKIHRSQSQQAVGQLHTGDQTGGGGLHIALHTGDLAGKGKPWLRDYLIVMVEQTGGVQIGVAVHDAVAEEFRVLQTGDHGEHPLLLRPGQVGLEAHDVVDGGP